MVSLDHQLIVRARRLVTGSNVHKVKNLIFAYEQAVDLHNRQWPTHKVYQAQYELTLRRFVQGDCSKAPPSVLQGGAPPRA